MHIQKKIFYEILEELDISPSIRSALLEQIYEIYFDVYRDERLPNKRYCRVELIVEERWKDAVEKDIKKLRKKKLISIINKKFFCKGVKFEINEKENSKRLIYQKEIVEQTIERYEKNYLKNAKYRDSIWKALCDLESYVKTYPNDSFHSKKPKYFPHISSHLLFPDKQDPKLYEQCYVYLYETRARGVKKFGISHDHHLRASQGGKNTYKKYLSSFLCNTRIEALSIEFCLMEEKHKLRDFPYEFFNTEQEWIDNKKLFEAYQLKIEKYKLAPNELTLLPVEIFNELVPKLASDYRKLDSFEFFKKHSPKTYAIHHEAVDKVLKQIWSITPLKRLVHERNRTDFEEIFREHNNIDKSDSIDLFDWSEEE